ncbi:helix-turn-helix domain-containing protein [Streptomyces sp. NPDC049555]|uniref:TetR/AcrR family transcriptional regulator n=1 Tax=unclassified Streptomyces TaxID=2593676 RepID=UPI0034229FD5
MCPRSPAVNEELRRRSRERLLQATAELVDERGFEETTLGDVADRAGAARGLISYYFPGKRQLLQSAVHRLMHLEIDAYYARTPLPCDGREQLARAIDAILDLTRKHPRLMRQHMANILMTETFIRCPDQQRLSSLLQETMAEFGSADPEADYRMLRALMMGAVVAVLVPGMPMPTDRLRVELFQRYGLPWELGFPPGDPPPTGV